MQYDHTQPPKDPFEYQKPTGYMFFGSRDDHKYKSVGDIKSLTVQDIMNINPNDMSPNILKSQGDSTNDRVYAYDFFEEPSNYPRIAALQTLLRIKQIVKNGDAKLGQIKELKERLSKWLSTKNQGITRDELTDFIRMLQGAVSITGYAESSVMGGKKRRKSKKRRIGKKNKKSRKSRKSRRV